jgi:hypothetical protein
LFIYLNKSSILSLLFVLMKAEAADDGGIDVPEEIVSTIGLT